LVEAADEEQGQAQVADLGEQAVQGRLVGDRPGDQGGRVVGLAGHRQPVESGRPALVEQALDADLVAHRCSHSSLSTGRRRRNRAAVVGLLGDVADAAVGGLVQAGDPVSYQFL
jgi:hypothetical protein